MTWTVAWHRRDRPYRIAGRPRRSLTRMASPIGKGIRSPARPMMAVRLLEIAAALASTIGSLAGLCDPTADCLTSGYSLDALFGSAAFQNEIVMASHGPPWMPHKAAQQRRITMSGCGPTDLMLCRSNAAVRLTEPRVRSSEPLAIRSQYRSALQTEIHLHERRIKIGRT